MIAGELFAKDSRSLETYLSVSNNLQRKLVLSLEPSIKFDERFRVTLIPIFYS